MRNNQQAICKRVGLESTIVSAQDITISMLEFQKDSILFSPGDSCQAFLILCEGSIRVEMTSKSGRDVTLYRMNKSESCILTTSALINNEHYYAQGIAETDITAIALSTEDFYKSVQYSNKFARYVLAGYATRVSSIIQLVDRMAARDVMLDVCLYLVNNIDDKAKVSATQIQIANEIGTAREVVGRKLHTLEAKGIVGLRRGVIEVHSISKLREYAKR